MTRTRRINHKAARIAESEALQLFSAKAAEDDRRITGRTVWGGPATTERSRCEAHCCVCGHYNGLRLIRGRFYCAADLFRVQQ